MILFWRNSFLISFYPFINFGLRIGVELWERFKSNLKTEVSMTPLAGY